MLPPPGCSGTAPPTSAFGGRGRGGPNVPKFGRKNNEGQQGGLQLSSSRDRWEPQANLSDHRRKSLLPSTVPMSCLVPCLPVIGVKGQ